MILKKMAHPEVPREAKPRRTHDILPAHSILAQPHPQTPTQRTLSTGFAPLNLSAGATAPSTSKPAGNSSKNPFEPHPIFSARQSTPTAAPRVSPDGAAENPRLGHLRDVMQHQELRSRAGRDRIGPALVVAELHE